MSTMANIKRIASTHGTYVPVAWPCLESFQGNLDGNGGRCSEKEEGL